MLFEYPVLARLLVTVSEHWARAVSLAANNSNGSMVPEANVEIITSATSQRFFTTALEPKFMRNGIKRSLELARNETSSGSLVTGIMPLLEVEKQILNREGDLLVPYVPFTSLPQFT